ncbi:MAG: nuclear transport factor 2 family protein [Acidimicrobiales bacterium]|nr:nuclear transport factor 2 family protein [Acidimicrobiales bacterium]
MNRGEDDPLAVVRSYFDHMQRGDVEVSSIFADDARLVGLGGEVVGRDAIDAFYRSSIERAAPAPRPLGPMLADGPRVAAEIEITLADGTVIHVMDLFEVHDGRIATLTYFVADH